MTRRLRNEDPEVLLEAATTAVRERDASGRIQPSPAWADLTPAQCDELFERQWTARVLEQGMDRRGLSTTGRTVLERVRTLPQLSNDEGWT